MNSREMKRYFIWGIATFLVLGSMLWFFGRPSSPPARDVADPEILTLKSQDVFKGNADARVTLVEYSDFQCPACASFYPFVKELTETYEDELLFVYRHIPLPYFLNSVPAARSAEAAGRQDAFFDMHDLLFQGQADWSDSRDPDTIFLGYAEEIGLDLEQFLSDYESDEVLQKIREDERTAGVLGVEATPTFFLNGRRMRYTDFDGFVDQVVTAINRARQTNQVEDGVTIEIDSENEDVEIIDEDELTNEQ
jgi:protein-disulfide isomerase